jgi:hypothetical protein
MEFVRRAASYSLLDHMRNKDISDKMKVAPIRKYVNSYRKNSLQHVEKNGQCQDSKTNVSICPHWTTTARKTKEKTV